MISCISELRMKNIIPFGYQELGGGSIIKGASSIGVILLLVLFHCARNAKLLAYDVCSLLIELQHQSPG